MKGSVFCCRTPLRGSCRLWHETTLGSLRPSSFRPVPPSSLYIHLSFPTGCPADCRPHQLTQKREPPVGCAPAPTIASGPVQVINPLNPSPGSSASLIKASHKPPPYIVEHCSPSPRGTGRSSLCCAAVTGGTVTMSEASQTFH